MEEVGTHIGTLERRKCRSTVANSKRESILQQRHTVVQQ
jgi:hypothetical protein